MLKLSMYCLSKCYSAVIPSVCKAETKNVCVECILVPSLPPSPPCPPFLAALYNFVNIDVIYMIRSPRALPLRFCILKT